MKRYAINEIFYSLQGEGMRAGTANVFVRFAGCNLTCQMEPSDESPGGWDCDTEFAGSQMMDLRTLLERMHAAQDGADCKKVILTGGEPLLQIDEDLVAALKDLEWEIAIETNGSIRISPAIDAALDWVTCSPKVAEHAVKIERANEVKYVRHAGQALPKPRCGAEHYLLSPAATATGVDRAALEWCIELVKKHPEWRLSMQQHKIWRVR